MVEYSLESGRTELSEFTISLAFSSFLAAIVILLEKPDFKSAYEIPLALPPLPTIKTSLVRSKNFF